VVKVETLLVKKILVRGKKKSSENLLIPFASRLKGVNFIYVFCAFFSYESAFLPKRN